MKLRYQMRGLGIGIIVTALLMGVALDDGVPLSDAEIRALASELGMVESDSLKLTDIHNTSTPSTTPTEQPQTDAGKDNQVPVTSEAPSGVDESEAGEENNNSQEGNTGDVTGNATAEPTGTSEPEQTKEPIETGEPTATDAPTGTTEPQITEKPDDAEYVEIVIQQGENSYGVSKRLAELGLVVDALEFDTYLCDYGYSRGINVGTYRIKVGTSEEEIAKIITKTK